MRDTPMAFAKKEWGYQINVENSFGDVVAQEEEVVWGTKIWVKK